MQHPVAQLYPPLFYTPWYNTPRYKVPLGIKYPPTLYIGLNIPPVPLKYTVCAGGVGKRYIFETLTVKKNIPVY